MKQGMASVQRVDPKPVVVLVRSAIDHVPHRALDGGDPARLAPELVEVEVGLAGALVVGVAGRAAAV
jgi:hypothetical protein